MKKGDKMSIVALRVINNDALEIKASCSLCDSMCCKDYTGVHLSEVELNRIAFFFKMSKKEICDKYNITLVQSAWNEISEDIYNIPFNSKTGNKKDRVCIFLHNNLCSIYPVRPFNCSSYPVGNETCDRRYQNRFTKKGLDRDIAYGTDKDKRAAVLGYYHRYSK